MLVFYVSFPSEGPAEVRDHLKESKARPVHANTLIILYKKQRKTETSPFLNHFCETYCSICDVIASLLQNKASNVDLHIFLLIRDVAKIPVLLSPNFSGFSSTAVPYLSLIFLTISYTGVS